MHVAYFLGLSLYIYPINSTNTIYQIRNIEQNMQESLFVMIRKIMVAEMYECLYCYEIIIGQWDLKFLIEILLDYPIRSSKIS